MPRILVLTLVAAFALPVTGAPAAVRFASPDGGTTPLCPPTSPCSLSHAITEAEAGDEVVVRNGTYSVAATIEASVSLKIHGERAGERPVVVGSSGITVLESTVKQEVADMTFESSEAGKGTLFLVGDGSVFERLQVVARGESSALRPSSSFTLRNSLLLASGPAANALFVQGAESGEGTIRNVTAVASGTESVGIGLSVTKPAGSVKIAAVNTIASGETDASAGGTPGGTGTIGFDHSNLDKFTGNVTATNSQTAPPLFANPAAGDYHEAFGSPTIAQGVVDPANGTVDLDGKSRTTPLFSCTTPPPVVTDIGAYESGLVPVPMLACGQSRAPNNFRFVRVILNRRKGTAKLIVKAPTAGVFLLKSGKVRRVKRKATRKGNVVLNVRPKPRTLKRLKRRHKMTVRIRVIFYPEGGTQRGKGRSLQLIRTKRHH